jgi:hypothetical protein
MEGEISTLLRRLRTLVLQVSTKDERSEGRGGERMFPPQLFHPNTEGNHEAMEK